MFLLSRHSSCHPRGPRGPLVPATTSSNLPGSGRDGVFRLTSPGRIVREVATVPVEQEVASAHWVHRQPLRALLSCHFEMHGFFALKCTLCSVLGDSVQDGRLEGKTSPGPDDGDSSGGFIEEKKMPMAYSIASMLYIRTVWLIVPGSGDFGITGRQLGSCTKYSVPHASVS